jgi:hypothetical protein
LAEQQRSNAALTAARIREAKVLPIYGSQAAIVGERQRIEADLGPVRYLAKFTGATDQTTMRWFILVVSLLLDPAAVLLLLAGSARP